MGTNHSRSPRYPYRRSPRDRANACRNLPSRILAQNAPRNRKLRQVLRFLPKNESQPTVANGFTPTPPNSKSTVGSHLHGLHHPPTNHQTRTRCHPSRSRHAIKMVHFIPTEMTATAPKTAKLFFDHIFRLHGLPKAIISDRDAKFTSRFWKTLFQLIEVKLAMSTAFHPQTDGQTERTNRTLEDMLRAFTNYQQTNWENNLTAAEFAYNTAVNTSTGLTPFQVNYGHQPINPYSQLGNLPDKTPAVKEILDEITYTQRITQDALALAKANQEKHANKK